MFDLFCNTVLSVLSSFAIMRPRKRELVALLELCSCCLVTVSVLCLFFAVPWVGLQCVTVALSCHAYIYLVLVGPCREKSCLQGFRQSEFQISLLSYRD